MRFRCLPLIVLSVLSLPVFGQGEGTDSGWQRLGRGIQCRTVTTEWSGSRQHIAAVRYRMRMHRTGILHAPAESADSTSALAAGAGAVAAVNGSYFNMKHLVPVTYLRHEGRDLSATTAKERSLRTDGILAVKKNGRMDIFREDGTGEQQIPRTYPEALSSGPVLLSGGRPARDSWPETGFYKKRHPRSIVGRDRHGWAYFIVIDGRFPGEGEGATIAEALSLARSFGLTEAINLDGGGSSTLWTAGTGVISHPCDNRRFDNYGQRIVPNIVYIR